MQKLARENRRRADLDHARPVGDRGLADDIVA
jgi:hypothetical protein